MQALGRQVLVPSLYAPLRGFVLLIAVGLFWGVNWPLMKIGMSVIPVFTFRTITVVGGGLCLLAMCRYLGYSLKIPRAQWPPLVLVLCRDDTA